MDRHEKNLTRYKSYVTLKRYFPNLKKECQICKSTKNVQIHHGDYEKSELLNLLCKKCHDECHKNGIFPEPIDFSKLKDMSGKYKKFVYKNLANLMLENNISEGDIAKTLSKATAYIFSRLINSGSNIFSEEERTKIQQKLFPDYDVGYLFYNKAEYMADNFATVSTKIKREDEIKLVEILNKNNLTKHAFLKLIIDKALSGEFDFSKIL